MKTKAWTKKHIALYEWLKDVPRMQKIVHNGEALTVTVRDGELRFYCTLGLAERAVERGILSPTLDGYYRRLPE